MRAPSALAFAAALAVLAAAPARAQSVQVGTLTCDISAGIGLIVGSQRQITCTFVNARDELEAYSGTIRRFGLDIGATSGGQLVWTVFAPSGRVERSALAGEYVGAGAEATIGAGLGANVLVGGSNRSVALQPLAFQGQSGLNVAGGVTSLELVPARVR